MIARVGQIGFSQLVRLQWLEYTASLVLAEHDRPAVEQALHELLQDKVSVGNQPRRGSLQKIVTILVKIWLEVPRGIEPLRRDGLKLLESLPATNRIAVHWGMAMAVYPFWGNVASQVGRLLTLQGSVRAAQIQRRLSEQYGERETVFQAARRVLRSYVDWGVLAKADNSGTYDPTSPVELEDPELVAWLLEASLHSQGNGSAALKELIQSPRLFPFRLPSIASAPLVTRAIRLEIVRHGLDDDLVMLRPCHR